MSQVAAFSRPASQMSGGGSKARGVPNLPEIQHPLSRLGNPDRLNVRGLTSRQGKRPATSGGPQFGAGTVMARGSDEVPFSSLTPRVSRSAAGFGPRDGAITSRRSLPQIPKPFSSIPEGLQVTESMDPSKTRIPVFGK